MSNFIVDPEEYGPRHGYPKGSNPFVNSRFGYTLDTDLKKGLKQAVRNNQLSLAVEYIALIIDIVDDLLGEESVVSEKPAALEASTAKSRKVSKGDSNKPEEANADEASE